jgi:1,4-dihydroxy-2-naphthoyl-CoA hydrolase
VSDAERTGPDAVRRYNEDLPWGEVPRLFGLEILEIERDRVRGRVPVTDRLLAGTGVLWAPVVVALADALCAAGTAVHLPEGASFTTLELKTNFLGTAATGDEVIGEAIPAHVGRSTQVWDVTATKASTGRVIALFRSTQMVLVRS